jgi:hypothetical protein
MAISSQGRRTMPLMVLLRHSCNDMAAAVSLSSATVAAFASACITSESCGNASCICFRYSMATFGCDLHIKQSTEATQLPCGIPHGHHKSACKPLCNISLFMHSATLTAEAHIENRTRKRALILRSCGCCGCCNNAVSMTAAAASRLPRF